VYFLNGIVVELYLSVLAADCPLFYLISALRF